MLHQWKWHRLTGLALIGLIGLGLAAPAPAADLKRLDTSLKAMPANTAFYTSMLRNREQFEALTKSRAWAKIMDLPLTKQLLAKLDEQLKTGELVKVREFFEVPENKQLLDVVLDMVSQEIFIYGGESWVGFTDLSLSAVGAAQMAPLWALLSDGPNAALFGSGKLQAQALLQVLKEKQDSLKIPDLIIGFKLTKKTDAEAQLKRLEKLLEPALAKSKFKGRLKRERVAGGDFLTLSADGSLVPWEDLPIKDLENKPGEFDVVIRKLKQLKLTVGLGIRDQYLLLVVGESMQHLATLDGGQRLIDRAEFRPLEKYAEERLTAVSYVSKAMMAQLGTSKQDVDDMLAGVKGLLAESKFLNADQRGRINKDLDEMAKDVKTLLPEPGAMLAFAFLTKRGQESFTYDWSETRSADSSKPLTILNHVGGTPLLVAAGRTRYQPEQYQMLVKWLKKANAYAEELALPLLDENTRDQYKVIAKIAHPLLVRLDKATGLMLLPALADGQTALVLDAKLASLSWHVKMPPAPSPLPLPELAVVCGVSDADLLKKAVKEYFAIANDVIAKLQELGVDLPPGFKVPEPKSKELRSGTAYYYPLPREWGLDERLIPTAGLSSKVLALTFSHEHAERLMASTPLKTDGGPLGNLNRPMSGAVYINVAATIDALKPWAEYVFKLADGKEEDLKQVLVIMDVMKSLRSFASCTYAENGATVTHSETVIEDLPR